MPKRIRGRFLYIIPLARRYAENSPANVEGERKSEQGMYFFALRKGPAWGEDAGPVVNSGGLLGGRHSPRGKLRGSNELPRLRVVIHPLTGESIKIPANS